MLISFRKTLSNITFDWLRHCVKRVRIWSYSGPHFFRIFPHSDWIRRDTEYLFVFGPNAGKSRRNADQNNSQSMSYEPVYQLVKGNWVNHIVKQIGTALQEVVRDFKGNSIAVKFRLAVIEILKYFFLNF